MDRVENTISNSTSIFDYLSVAAEGVYRGVA
jgi:hypothetical protein